MIASPTESTIATAILDAIPEPFFVFDEEGRYLQILGGVDREKFHEAKHLIGQRIHDVINASLADSFVEQIRQTIAEQKPRTFIYQLAAADVKGSENLPGPEGIQWFEAHISPIQQKNSLPDMVVWVAFNITKLKNALTEKQTLINELETALGEIKTLKGILPICSYCKKIKDNNGSWNELEKYIKMNSEANISHGICPDCFKENFPEIASKEQVQKLFDKKNG